MSIRIGNPQCAYRPRRGWYVAREREQDDGSYLVSFVIVGSKSRPTPEEIGRRIHADGKTFDAARDWFAIIPPEGANLDIMPAGYEPF